VRLIVIDSIAALFRLDYGLDEASARASNLFTIALSLKRLAGKHGAAIVCTNQV
jgi:RecA/RadA recombinase